MPTYIAKIPNPIPPPFHDFNAGWLEWVSLLDGETLLLEKKSSMSSGQIPDEHFEEGYYVRGDNLPRPKGITVNWLPEAWVRECTSQPKPCDCSSRKLFQQGCPGH